MPIISSNVQFVCAEKTMAMLQAHGIMMLPKDESTIVASAVNSGQKVQLTGKSHHPFMCTLAIHLIFVLYKIFSIFQNIFLI